MQNTPPPIITDDLEPGNMPRSVQPDQREEAVKLVHESSDLQQLMNTIDELVARFCAVTGARGKAVKKRWRKIKNSDPNTTPHKNIDPFEALREIIRDYFVRQGYVADAETWEFQVIMESQRRSHRIVINLLDDRKIDPELVYSGRSITLAHLYDEATAFFTRENSDGND